MLYAHLLQDSHHEQVCKFADMACCATKLRRLWKMVFYPVSTEQFRELVGYVSPAPWFDSLNWLGKVWVL